MLELKSLLAGLTLLVISIVPSVSNQRPRTKQQSRGTRVWTDLSKLALQNKDKLSDPTTLHLKTIACVGRHSSDGITDAQLLAATLTIGAAYYRDLVAVDLQAVQTLFAECRDQEAAKKVARNSNIDLLAWCELQADRGQLSVTVSSSDATAAPRVFTLPASGQWLASAGALRSQLFGSLGFQTSVDKATIERLPTQKATSLRAWLEGSYTLQRVLETNDPVQRKKLGEQARDLASQAIAQDAAFLEAYLLKASCCDEFDEGELLTQTLRTAYALRNPQTCDLLTLHELEGDYAHFCTGELEAAIEHYKQILKINPTDLRSLWCLVDIHLTGDGANTPLPEDIAEASMYAAQIILAHPHSAIAKALTDK